MFNLPTGRFSVSRQNINICRHSRSKMVYLYSELMQRVRLITLSPYCLYQFPLKQQKMLYKQVWLSVLSLLTIPTTAKLNPRAASSPSASSSPSTQLVLANGVLPYSVPRNEKTHSPANPAQKQQQQQHPTTPPPCFQPNYPPYTSCFKHPQLPPHP